MQSMIQKLKKREAGFTLVELMIVVVIIGILAAIAIPNFIKFQLRSKAGEVGQVAGGIHSSQAGFAAKWGAYVQATQQPAATPIGGQKSPWAIIPTEGHGLTGYSPQGRTFHSYVVSDNGGAVYDVTNVTVLPAVAGNGTFGNDPAGYPCAIAGGSGCTAVNNVPASLGSVDIYIAAIGNLDSDANSCTYAITDENKDLLPNITNGVCGEGAF